MNTRAPSPPSLKDLRKLTPARIGLGIAGASLPTVRCSNSRWTMRGRVTLSTPCSTPLP